MIPKPSVEERRKQARVLRTARGLMYQAYVHLGMSPIQASYASERQLKKAVLDGVLRTVDVKLMRCGCVSGHKHGAIFRCSKTAESNIPN